VQLDLAVKGGTLHVFADEFGDLEEEVGGFEDIAGRRGEADSEDLVAIVVEFDEGAEC
jgi:hypothetical protein